MLALFALALLALPCLANFRIQCTALSHERLDPLLSPGKVSSHVHDFFGGSNIGIQSPSFDTLRKSSCTSCEAKEDKSAYWTPALYFQWKNGSFSIVPNEGLEALYYWPDTQQNTAQAYPAGFRMISGNAMLRSNQKAPSQKYNAVNFACLGTSNPDTPYLPKQSGDNKCDTIRADIYFPNCWNGVDMDSTDHSSHVAYSADTKVTTDGSSEGSYGATLPGHGACPKTHPKRLISLSLSRYFDTTRFDYSKAKNPSQPFVFANGDPTGYGFHGDILTGWDPKVLGQTIKQCTYKDGSPEFCPPLTLQDTNQSEAPNAELCRRTPTVNEVVTGLLPKLPGCNPVQKGPGNATPATNCPVPPTFSKPVVYSGPVPPVGVKETADVAVVVPSYKHYKYSGCYSTSSKTPALTTKVAISGKITPQKCLAACESKKLAYCGMQGKTCFGAKKISTSSKAQKIGVCYTQCAGSLNYCGGPKAVSIYSRSA